MNRRLIVRPEAEADITDAALWYESREPGLGLDLVSDVQAAIERALKDPKKFPRLRNNPPVRRVLVRRFPIVFSLLSDLTGWSCLLYFTPLDMTKSGSDEFHGLESSSPKLLTAGLIKKLVFRALMAISRLPF